MPKASPSCTRGFYIHTHVHTHTHTHTHANRDIHTRVSCTDSHINTETHTVTFFKEIRQLTMDSVATDVNL